MKWFEGSISEAVVTSKRRKAIFVVFVEGKNDTSTQVAQAINATEVSARLEQEDFVAIRLESGSETYRFFAQIYQLVPVPSIFFIGDNGTPLEIVAGAITASDLLSKIDSVLAKSGKKNNESSSSFISAEQDAAIAGSTSNNSDISNKPECTNDVCNINAEVSKSNDVPTEEDATKKDEKMVDAELPAQMSDTQEEAEQQDLTPEQKVERAKQLIELQKKQRVEEEEKKQRELEISRRKVGREVQKMRRKQQDIEFKQAHEERMKEKAAEAEAREKVRQQIAQDKLERKQRELNLQQQMQQQSIPETSKPYTPVVSDSTVTRIQFRLPSGNPHMGQFESTSTLHALRTYVLQNIELPFRQFAMSTSFPRRDLTHDDDNKTLLELELVPTAVILILPLKNSNIASAVSSSQNLGFLSRLMWSLFAPIIGAYNYIADYFTGGGNRNGNQQPDDSSTPRDSASNDDATTLPNLQSVPNSSGLYRRYAGNQGRTTIRAEGNIRRLHSGGDDNDENNTWNGNSTQQM